MNRHINIPTSAEVWAVIKARHPELIVFSSYSAPDGDQFGDPSVCVMKTEYGFKNSNFPIIGAETKWEKPLENSYKRVNERTEYWICAALETDD